MISFSLRRSGLSRGGGICFVVGLLLSLAVWWQMDVADESRVHAEFTQAVDSFAASLDAQIAEDIVVLRSLKGLFDASEVVTELEFHSFAEFLLAHYPSLAAVGWAPHVLASSRGEFEVGLHVAGGGSGRITERHDQGKMVAAGMRTEYFPVRFMEPLDGNRAALFFDLASDPIRRGAIHAARDSGAARATERITLVQETGEAFAVLVLVPVYGGEPTTVEERRTMLQGCISGVFRFSDLLREAGASTLPVGLVDFRLQDESCEGEPVALYRSRLSVPTSVSLPSYRRPLKLAVGRQWALLATPSSAYLAAGRSPAPVLTFVGLILTLAILTLYLSMLGHEKQRVEQQVVHRTRELNAKSVDLETANTNLKHEVAERRELQSRFADVVDHEQRRLGQELHDSLGQQVAACAMLTQALRDRLKQMADSPGELLDRLGQAMRTAQSQVRALSKGILPVPIDEGGLVSALEDLVASVSGVSDMAVTFDAGEDLEATDSVTATHLYRIAQEALRNALEHGQGLCVAIRLDSDGAGLRLTIRDDGRGLDELGHGHGSGLSIMRHRAELIGASLKVTSRAQEGTSVVCALEARRALPNQGEVGVRL